MNEFSYSESWANKCITAEIHNGDNTWGGLENNL